MKIILLASIAVTIVHCKGPVFIEELESLVENEEEKLELRNLAEDVYMIRPGDHRTPRRGDQRLAHSDTQPPLAMHYKSNRPDSSRINPHRPDSSTMKILQTPATALCVAV
ncbi:hypothetical protein Y032_0031g2292 [Ancylostoma ceylanicum]|uniref:Uncharacterized protein n=1 Tax=Ancylostoma ceylanicum TaxID=53326 RepID=A0A016UQD4_9BILA|nr:hypothetical protein Y032_0031g2292 [Ancylostoma ceylanicum]